MELLLLVDVCCWLLIDYSVLRNWLSWTYRVGRGGWKESAVRIKVWRESNFCPEWGWRSSDCFRGCKLHRRIREIPLVLFEDITSACVARCHGQIWWKSCELSSSGMNESGSRGGGGLCAGASPEQFVIYAERLINLCISLYEFAPRASFFHQDRTEWWREARKRKEGPRRGKERVLRPDYLFPHQTPATWCWCRRQGGLRCSRLDLGRFVLPDNAVLLLLSEASFHDWWNELREWGKGSEGVEVTLKALTSLSFFSKRFL